MSTFLSRAAAGMKAQQADAQQTEAQPEVVDFRLDQIDSTPVAQGRVMLNARKVDEYAADMATEEGLAEFRHSPIHLFQDPGTGRVYISRGYTRVAAARKVGLETFPARVYVGDKRACIVHSLGSNATHGDKRNHADLMHELDMVLTDPELTKWSDREISRRVKCHHNTVAKRREWLAEQGQAEKPAERTYVDKHGNTGTMSVSGIQGANAGRAAGTGAKVLDLPGTYSVIQRALAQQPAGVEARYAWLREREAHEDFAAYVPPGFKLDPSIFGQARTRAYEELAARMPKGKTAPAAPAAPAAPEAPAAPAQPANGSRFVPPVRPTEGLTYDRKALDTFNTLAVYMGEIADIAPMLARIMPAGSLAGFDLAAYLSQTGDLLQRVIDVQVAMEALGKQGADDEGDDDAADDEAE